MATEDYEEVWRGNRSMEMMETMDAYDPFEFHNRHYYWIVQCFRIFCPIAIFGGIFTNIFAFAVLVRSRLWFKHEGYVYLAANLCVNVAILTFCTSTSWLSYAGHSYYLMHSSNFMCKMWHFFMSVSFFAPGWLSVALLFSVYLREHLTHRRRCGCPIFAAKYCTLFASKIIVSVIFSVLFIFGVPYVAAFKLHDVGYCHAPDHLAVGVSLLVEAIMMWVLPVVFFLPIILLMTLCTKREGDSFGFSQIEERKASDEQMRVVAATLSSMTLFSQFVLVVFHMFFLPFFHVGSALLVLAHGLSLGLQPILCFIILKELRDGVRSQLRGIRCCRRLFPSLDRDEGVVQLTAIEEDPPSSPEE